ncbi:hypothetical protein DUNSADRAFT_4005, partial [Dunaliella salina]
KSEVRHSLVLAEVGPCGYTSKEMAERPKPSLNPLNDEELANDAAVRIATAAAGPPGGPKASHGPRPALSLAQLTSGFSHTLRR